MLWQYSLKIQFLMFHEDEYLPQMIWYAWVISNTGSVSSYCITLWQQSLFLIIKAALVFFIFSNKKHYLCKFLTQSHTFFRSLNFLKGRIFCLPGNITHTYNAIYIFGKDFCCYACNTVPMNLGSQNRILDSRIHSNYCFYGSWNFKNLCCISNSWNKNLSSF